MADAGDAGPATGTVAGDAAVANPVAVPQRPQEAAAAQESQLSNPLDDDDGGWCPDKG